MASLHNVDLRKWNVLDPVDTEFLRNLELVFVFGLDASSAFLVTTDDEVYAIGNNVQGRLGLGDISEDIIDVPARLDALCGKNILYFTSSSQHVAALTMDGDVYLWGGNSYGQVGNGSIEDETTPTKVYFPEGEKIIDVSTSERYTLALSQSNKLYHWGDVYWTFSDHMVRPSVLEISLDVGPVSSIVCGAHHAAAVTENGKVLTWGVNDFGQLGTGQVEILATPTVVGGQLEDQFIVKVVCSFRATLALTSDGGLYIWGYNKASGVPVGDETEVINLPQRVVFVKRITNIAANNLLHILCAAEEESQNIYVWGREDCSKSDENKFSTILEAFHGQAMPLVIRSDKTIFRTFQGPVRDLGKALFNKKETSDLTILLADGEIFVHKLIMRTFCDHFKTVLDDNWTNGRAVINMTQYNPKAYRAFLRYVYTGTLDRLEGPEIIALCDIAVSYFETDLKNLCIEMFNSCLTVHNVVQLYAQAIGNHSLFGLSFPQTINKIDQQNQLELAESCIQFTSQHLVPVLLTPEFESLAPYLCKSLVINAARLRN